MWCKFCQRFLDEKIFILLFYHMIILIPFLFFVNTQVGIFALRFISCSIIFIPNLFGRIFPFML